MKMCQTNLYDQNKQLYYQDYHDCYLQPWLPLEEPNMICFCSSWTTCTDGTYTFFVVIHRAVSASAPYRCIFILRPSLETLTSFKRIPTDTLM